MLRNWLGELRKYLIFSGAALFAAAGVSQAQQPLPPAAAPAPAAAAPAPTDVQAQLQAQQKRIEELENLIRSGQVRPASADADGKGKDDPKPLTDADVKKIVGDYLKENPGANLNNGVQTGYEYNKGFIMHRPGPQVDQLGRPEQNPLRVAHPRPAPGGRILLQSG